MIRLRGKAWSRKVTAGTRTEPEQALQRAKRERNVAKEQERITALLKALKRLGVPLQDWQRQLPFFGPKKSRPWKFDLAEPRLLIAVEVDGGSYSGKPCPACGQRPGGRHSRGAREAERRKLNTAAAYGWVVLSFSGESIDKDALDCAELVAQAYRSRYMERT